MRLGITFPFEHHGLADATGLLGRAEELGYQEAWSYERNVYDAFTPLAAAAVATRTMRLGTSIVPAFTRPPGLVAMSAAALAELAPGRFALGVGASTAAVVNGWMGLPYGRPLSRVRETVLSLRALLAGEKVGGLRLHRPPPGPVPIYVAALGERMLALAGELADGVAFFLAGAAGLPHLLAGVGRELESVARVVVVAGDDHGQNLAFGRRYLAGYALVPAYARSLERQGFGAEVGAVQARWSAGDRQSAAGEVSEAMVRELMLVATDPDLERRLRAYAGSGLGTLDLWPMSPSPDEGQRRKDVWRALEALAPAVAARPG